MKKKGGDRHWADHGKITIDAGAIDEYLQITGATELDPSRFVVSTAIKPPDAKKFHDLENQPLTRPMAQFDQTASRSYAALNSRCLPRAARSAHLRLRISFDRRSRAMIGHPNSESTT